MARELSPFGVDVDLNVEDGSVDIKLFERVDDDREVRDTRRFSIRDVHSDLQLKVGLYGLSKILQDRTSDQSKLSTRLSGMDEVFDRLKEGAWEKEREAGGPTVSAEVEALAVLKGVSVADIQKALRRYDPEAKAKILSSDRVQEKADEIRAAREATNADELSFDDIA